MALVNNIPLENFRAAELVVLLSDCKLQAAVEQLTEEHSALALDFFRATSAGECLVVSSATLCGAKLNSLTPLGSVVLPLLKITMWRTSLAALCNEILLVLGAPSACAARP
jgi:hypothetical protein